MKAAGIEAATYPAREVLHAGELLVAPPTDPGWTPLFVHAAGLVTDLLKDSAPDNSSRPGRV